MGALKFLEDYKYTFIFSKKVYLLKKPQIWGL